jgi:fibronectin type 3 domain-containing protein
MMLPGCSSPIEEGEEDPPPETSGTYIRFTNKGNDFSVSLYTDPSRLSKLIAVAAGAVTDPVKTSPDDFGVFYPTYHTIIDDIEFLYEGAGLAIRIDAEKTTDIVIPLLADLDPAELTKPITTGVYLKLQNAGSSSLVLQHGNYPEIPQNMPHVLVNGGETAIYTVNTGSVSNYSFLKNGVTPIAFPGELPNFIAGHLYLLKFDGASFTLVADKPITIAQVLKIEAPENLRAESLSNGHISLVWDKVAAENSYGIYRSDSSTGNYTKTGTANTTSYTDTTVAVGNTYYYRLSSIKGNVESEKSRSAVSAKSERSSLPPPSGLTVAGQTADSVSLSWSPVPDASGYTIYKGSAPAAVNEYVAALSSTAYTVTGLMSGTTYYFAVSSVNQGVESLPSAAVPGTTAAIAPSAPTGLLVTNLMSGSVSLSWNSAANAVSYEVYRSSSKDGTPAKIGSTGETAYTDSSVTPNTAYYYTVGGVNASGTSPQSDQAFAVAVIHNPLPTQAESTSRTLSNLNGEKHYYRFSVSAGQSYSIGNTGYVSNYIVCSAWQNDGSSVFLDANLNANPRTFTASKTGYVTVEVKNIYPYSGYSASYRIYYE